MAWQRIGREQRAVAVSYVTAGTEYGFRLGPHDPAVAVVIDPLLQSTYLGGSSPFEEIVGMGLDAAGNVYVAGGTSSFDFPGTTGGAQPTPSGFGAYVAKLNPTLTTLVQSTYLGGSSNESVGGLVVNAAGEVLVAGWTSSSTFPGTSGAAQSVYGGGPFDGFVTKLAGDLKSIIRTTFLGGTGDDQVAGIRIDAAGNIVVAGRTTSTDLPGTASGAQPTNRGASDGFVARVTDDLGTLVRSTYLGGTGLDYAMRSRSTQPASSMSPERPGPPTSRPSRGARRRSLPEPRTHSSRGSPAISPPSARSRSWAAIRTTPRGHRGRRRRDHLRDGIDEIRDPSRNRGGALSTRPNTGTNLTTFVARFATDLKSIMQSTYLGGSTSDTPAALVIDGAGNVYVAGQSLSASFPGSQGTGAAFVARLAADLKTVTRSLRMGGGAADKATSLAFDASGNLVVGGFSAGGFSARAEARSPPWRGFGSLGDGFISRMTADLQPGPAVRFELTTPASAAIECPFPSRSRPWTRSEPSPPAMRARSRGPARPRRRPCPPTAPSPTA
jgi:hypothetical protein